MAKQHKVTKAGGISGEVVQIRTGKGWDEWFAVPPCWRQMVTVAYEQARGLRKKHQTPQGYQASASKTVAVPIDTLYSAWADPKRRARRLPDGSIKVSTTRPNTSSRGAWVDGKSRLDVNFWGETEGAAGEVARARREHLPVL